MVEMRDTFGMIHMVMPGQVKAFESVGYTLIDSEKEEKPVKKKAAKKNDKK